jgi:hypothetical protein
LLKSAKDAASSTKKIGMKGARTIVEHALDHGTYTAVEHDTIDYIKENFQFEPKALKYLTKTLATFDAHTPSKRSRSRSPSKRSRSRSPSKRSQSRSASKRASSPTPRKREKSTSTRTLDFDQSPKTPLSRPALPKNLSSRKRKKKQQDIAATKKLKNCNENAQNEKRGKDLDLNNHMELLGGTDPVIDDQYLPTSMALEDTSTSSELDSEALIPAATTPASTGSFQSRVSPSTTKLLSPSLGTLCMSQSRISSEPESLSPDNDTLMVPDLMHDNTDVKLTTKEATTTADQSIVDENLFETANGILQRLRKVVSTLECGGSVITLCQEFDADNDKRLSKSEFGALLSHFGFTNIDATVTDELFEMFDVDDSNSIDYFEFIKLISYPDGLGNV